jgi:gentisate 1,2-dioxygenase
MAKCDRFAIPLWLRHHQENGAGKEFLIFSINDRRFVEATVWHQIQVYWHR